MPKVLYALAMASRLSANVTLHKWKGVLDCAYVIICVLDWDHRSAQL